MSLMRFMLSPFVLWLEVEILEGLGGRAVRLRGLEACALGEHDLTASHQDGCALTRQAEELEVSVGDGESRLSLLVQRLGEKGTRKHELRIADLAEEVFAVG
jgi:hypothetical protein